MINVLKDGTKVTDMSKIKVPVNEKTIRAYQLIAAGRVLANKQGDKNEKV